MAATLRLASRVAAILIAFPPALLLHGIWRAVPGASPWPRRYLRFVAWAIGARVHCEGAALRRDVLFLANHTSWLDIPVLAGATGTAFVGKGELARAPIVGWLARLNATVFVDRAARMAVGAQVAQIRRGMADGRPLTIFPEGTTGDGRTLLPFKPALLAVAEDAPPALRIQPVRIDYGAATQDIAWVDDEPGTANVRRILARRGTVPVTLTFLDPFDPRAFAGRKAIAAEAARRIGGRGASPQLADRPANG